MNIIAKILFFAFAVGFCLIYRQDVQRQNAEVFVSLIVDPNQANVELFWKNDGGEIFGSIENLKKFAEDHGKRLRFAMNGGMYQEDRKPLGLFVQNGETVTPLNLRRAAGNFYLQPNGVFYLNDERRAFVVQTANFQNDAHVKFATQSGPMLIVDGKINPVFTPDSSNLYVRNAVCALENSKIIFSISRRPVNFYDFAAYLKDLGCQNALYLDGFVSRMYAPELNVTQTDGNFGVIIGIVE